MFFFKYFNILIVNVDCDFNPCNKWATPPCKARHMYDDHPLFLTYNDPNDYQFVCQICESHKALFLPL
jgi:hypothetical protein